MKYMKKCVGIVSCYFKNNYGSILQAYATKKFLDDNNIKNETINISKNKDFKKGKIKYYIQNIYNFKFIKSKIGMIKLKIYKSFIKDLNKNIKLRNEKFDEFRKKINLSLEYTNYKELSKESGKKYDTVIVGSDQLWLPVNVVSDYYTLNWVSDTIKKVSYSTSFGVSNIPKKYHKKYKFFLKKINYLSVREDSGANMIKEITNKDAKIVCDPTILLTKDKWDEIAGKNRIIKGKYILCYFLGNNLDNIKFLKELKRKTGFKIVSLNYLDEYVKYLDEISDITLYDIGPSEWLNLIKNAEMVCTDSFHGTVFSLIYNVNFFTFRRNKNNRYSTNSRIDSILNKLDVNNRIINGYEKIDDLINNKIDFKKVNKNLKTFRNESEKWLVDILKKED